MKDPLVFRRNDTLLPAEANYWKDLFYRVTKIGTELEVAPPKGMRRPEFEAGVHQGLAPSGDIEQLGRNGVLDVQPEHCGIEIRVIGRHPHFLALRRQYTGIMDIIKAHGARARPTCGMHFHLLTPGLAEPAPEIILANLWNLTRRYAPELKFMTSAGEKREALCRRRNHNSHLETVRHSSGMMAMADIQHILKKSRTVPEHQNFLNLEHLGFNETGQIQPFPLEFRFPDVDLSPTSVTAKTFLFLAMLLKAVDLSQYGVIHVGKIGPWRRKIELLNMLNNNDGKLATSDTSGVTDDIIEELRQGAYELLDLLIPTFERFADNPALDVLLALAEQPVSLLRCAGYDWDDIETNLVSRASVTNVELDKTDRRLMQSIELGEWTRLPSTEAWQWRAARELFLTSQELERRLERLQSLRGLRWDSRQGTMIFTS
ncbi:MAG TPA: hypothetical protein VGD99_21640 [Anaerolineae bacterium]